MKVIASAINTTAGTRYILKKAGTDRVIHAPNKWKTEKGALKWALSKGYEIA